VILRGPKGRHLLGDVFGHALLLAAADGPLDVTSPAVTRTSTSLASM
jgi:hypothetical protein